MIRYVLIHHTNGNELIIFGETNFKDNQELRRQSRLNTKFDNAKLSNTFKELIERLNPKIIITDEIHGMFNYSYLLSRIVSLSKSLQDKSDICIAIPQRNKLHSIQGIDFDKNYIEAKRLVDQSKIKPTKDILRYKLKSLNDTKEIVILHEQTINREREQRLKNNDKLLLFLKYETETQEQSKERSDLLVSAQNIVKTENLTDQYEENLDYIHYSIELFKTGDNVSKGTKGIYLDRVFKNIETSDDIVAMYYMNLRSQHLNILKLHKVKHSGIEEPFLNTYNILKYRRRNVNYSKLENYLVRRKKNFIWFKVNLTKEDKTNFFDDILADVFLYETGLIEILIGDSKTDIEPSQLNTFIEKCYHDILDNMGEEQFYSYTSEPIIRPTVSILREPIDHISMLRELKYRIAFKLTNNFSKRSLTEITSGFGNFIRVMDNEDKSHMVMNLKLGNCVSDLTLNFLPRVEQAYYKYEIPDNMKRFNSHILATSKENEGQQYVRVFLEKYFYNKRSEIAITSGPIIKVKKTDLRSLVFEINNIHDLQTLDYTKHICLVIHKLLNEKSGKKIKKIDKNRVDVLKKKDGDSVNDIVFEDDDNADFNFDDGGLVDEDDDILDDIMDFEEGEEEDNKSGEKAEEDKKNDGDKREEEEGGEEEEEVIDLGSIKRKSYYLDRLQRRQKLLFNYKPTEGIISYPRSCDKRQERQPVILSKKEFKAIMKNHAGSFGFDENMAKNMEEFNTLSDEDKEKAMEDFFVHTSIKGKKQYYICPKYWCITENRPITEEEIERGECGGKIIDPSKTPKELYDEYNKDRYILSRFTETNYFKSTRHPGEKIDLRSSQAIPKYLKKKHPEYGKKLGNKGCLPCCFKYIKQNPNKPQKKLSVMDKVKQSCLKEYDGEPDEEKQQEEEVIEQRKDVRYIVDKQGFNLNKNTISLLPSRMDNFIFHEKRCLDQHSHMSTTIPGCIFRMGTGDNTTDNLFKIISIVSNKKDPENVFIENLIDNYGMKEFMTYYRGNLPDTFYNPEVEVPQTEYSKINKQYKTVLDKVSMDTEDDPMRNHYINSYYNFIKYTKDGSEIKLLDFYWEYFSNSEKYPFEKKVNLMIFDMRSDNGEIMLKCPKTGLTKYHYHNSTIEEPIPHIFLFKRRYSYQPIFYMGWSKGKYSANALQIKKFDFYPELIREYNEKSIGGSHVKHIMRSIDGLLQNYKKQCNFNNKNNFSLLNGKYMTGKFNIKGEEYVLDTLYIGNDNKIHIAEFFNKTTKKKYPLALSNHEIELDLYTWHEKENERPVVFKKLNEYNKPKYNEVSKFIRELIAEHKPLEEFFGIKYYGKNGKKFNSLIQNNGGILLLEDFTKRNIPEEMIYSKENTSDMLDYIFEDGEFNASTETLIHKTLNIMKTLLFEKIEKSYSNKDNILQMTMLTDFNMYLLKNKDEMKEFIANQLTDELYNFDEVQIFAYMGMNELKKKQKHMLYESTKIKSYMIKENREDIIELLLTTILKELYTEESIRNMIRNNTYKYSNVEINTRESIIITEQELNEDGILHLRKVNSSYIQNEHHYEVIDLEKVKHNVLQKFYGIIQETKPVPKLLRSRFNWNRYLMNSIIVIGKEREINGWDAFTFGLTNTTDVDDFKETYIHGLIKLFFNKGDIAKNIINFYKKMEDEKKTELMKEIIEDQLKESLSSIIDSDKYYITNFDIEMLAKIFKIDIYILKSSPLLMSTTNKNYGTLYENKNNTNIIVLFESVIPAEKFKKYEVVMFYHDINEEEEKYKTINTKNVMKSGQNEIFYTELQDWKKKGFIKKVNI